MGTRMIADLSDCRGSGEWFVVLDVIRVNLFNQ